MSVGRRVMTVRLTLEILCGSKRRHTLQRYDSTSTFKQFFLIDYHIILPLYQRDRLKVNGKAGFRREAVGVQLYVVW